MTSEVLSCCCGGSGSCCPCNPLEGGRSSWLVTYSSSFTLYPNLSCQCSSQHAGYTPDGVPVSALMMVDPPISRTGGQFVSTWVNTTDPLAANYCNMTGFEDPVAGAPTINGHDYWPQVGGGCPQPLPEFPPFNTFVRVRRRILVFPPRFPCPLNNLTQPIPWQVWTGAGLFATFRFRGSFNCASPGPFVLDLANSLVGGFPITSPSGTQTCVYPQAVMDIAYNAGTVTLT